MEFINDDFLLNNEIARELYSYASKMPIIDYHCHLSPKEIYEDKHFDNITELWLGGDHYKWRLMRSAGIQEEYITGNASDKDKFFAWAKTISLAIGNPLYDWSHLELKNYFGFDGVLDENSAQEVWDLCNEKLRNMSARQLIKDSNVELLCTTDDPVDDLEYHKALKAQEDAFRVLPTWRPDKLVNIEKDNWNEYIDKLEVISNKTISSYTELLLVIEQRLDYFESVGCHLADHGLSYIPYEEYEIDEIEKIFNLRRNNKSIDNKQAEQFKTFLLYEMMKQYHSRNWIAQFHYGVLRDNSSYLLNRIGNDAGGDNIGESGTIYRMSRFLDMLDKDDILPKTIFYSLNPNDNTAIDTLIASFQKGPSRSKLQHGSAWWFNDNYEGMRKQMISLASQGYIAGFVGMLTDSRSFISYARHEYFRRILCELISDYVLKGRYPKDYQKLKKIVEDISYNNTKEYFNF